MVSGCALVASAAWFAQRPLATPARSTPVDAPDAGVAVPSAEPDVAEAGLAAARAEQADGNSEDAGPNIPPRVRCAELTKETRRVGARIKRANADCGVDAKTLVDDLHPCREADAGVWAFVPKSFAIEREFGVDPTEPGHCWSVTINVALVHVDQHGAWAEGDLPVSLDYMPHSWGATRFAPPQFFDFDGDGDLEVFFSACAADEGPDREWAGLYSFKDGMVQTYPQARGLEVTTMEDVDHDGRPDLGMAGPYGKVEALSPVGNAPYRFMRSHFIQHSLPDGTFSTTDAVALADFRAQCPHRPALDAVPTNDIDEAAFAIACARAWGASEAEVRAELEPECDAWCRAFNPDDCDVDAGITCPRWTQAVARIRPPLRLR